MFGFASLETLRACPDSLSPGARVLASRVVFPHRSQLVLGSDSHCGHLAGYRPCGERTLFRVGWLPSPPVPLGSSVALGRPGNWWWPISRRQEEHPHQTHQSHLVGLGRRWVGPHPRSIEQTWKAGVPRAANRSAALQAGGATEGLPSVCLARQTRGIRRTDEHRPVPGPLQIVRPARNAA